MNIKELLQLRLEEIAHSLIKTNHALALLALGSCGLEQERMDEYSDLDFFVICEKGYKLRYIENLDWLSSIQPLSYSYQNTTDGHKVLFDDGVFCEFAVFEPEELSSIPFVQGKIVWQVTEFDASVCIPKELKSKEKLDVDWLIGEALCNLYIGLGRYYRGEKLSAYKFIESYAADSVLELISIIEKPINVKEDVFSIQRRFEFRYPSQMHVLPGLFQGYNNVVESAKAILFFLDENFTINEKMKNKILSLCNKNEK